MKWIAFRDILLKGFVYKYDLLDFLAHPLNRVRKIYGYNRDLMARQYRYTGTEDSLDGLRIDWQRRVMHFPDRLPPEERKTIREILFNPRPTDTGKLTVYLKANTKSISRYRNKSIFPPRAEGSRFSTSRATKLSSAVRQLATRPDVIMLDEHLFDQLERPEFFADALHLNREGMERFSRILALEIRQHLGLPVF